MKNYLNEGEILTLTAPAGGVVSGLGYVIGGIFVVAQVSAAAGAEFTGVRVGRVTLPKTAAQAWTQGQRLFWNNTTKVLTNASASGLFLVGATTDIAASADTVGNVVLDGISVVAVP